MLRLTRLRRKDPARLAQNNFDQVFEMDEPKLDRDFAKLPVEDLIEHLPDTDTRRALLARDPLACVDGFRTLVWLTLRFLFGMK
eukprot:4243306-Prorocentrum_lima.AAC.1